MRSRFPFSILRFLLLASVLLTFGGCNRGVPSDTASTPRPKGQLLVKIGSEEYVQSQFDAFLKERFPETSNPISNNNRVLSELLDEAINERLMLQAAAEKQITATDREVQEYLTNSSLVQNPEGQGSGSAQDQRATRAKEILTVNRYFQSITQAQRAESSADIKNYYDSHPEAFQEPERYHVQEILVKDEPLAQAIVDMLAKHRSFESLAQKYSINPVASQGGDLGWFAKGELPEQLERAVTGLKPGRHSRIAKTDYGYHIFKLREIQEGHKTPFDQARKQIQSLLENQKKSEAVAQEISRLRKNTSIEIQHSNLGFKYVGDTQGD
jgi:peptidyl-prolyl cis-trans isomerase C